MDVKEELEIKQDSTKEYEKQNNKLKLRLSVQLGLGTSTPGLYLTFGRHFLSKVVFYTFVLTTRHPFTEMVKRD